MDTASPTWQRKNNEASGAAAHAVAIRQASADAIDQLLRNAIRHVVRGFDAGGQGRLGLGAEIREPSPQPDGVGGDRTQHTASVGVLQGEPSEVGERGRHFSRNADDGELHASRIEGVVVAAGRTDNDLAATNRVAVPAGETRDPQRDDEGQPIGRYAETSDDSDVGPRELNHHGGQPDDGPVASERPRLELHVFAFHAVCNSRGHRIDVFEVARLDR
jgi:hypothetical protein